MYKVLVSVQETFMMMMSMPLVAAPLIGTFGDDATNSKLKDKGRAKSQMANAYQASQNYICIPFHAV